MREMTKRNEQNDKDRNGGTVRKVWVVLAMAAISNIYAQSTSYRNADFHFQYNAPTGWTIDDPSVFVGVDGGSFRLRHNQLKPGYCLVLFGLDSSAKESAYNLAFSQLKVPLKSYAEAPSVGVIMDTAISISEFVGIEFSFSAGAQMNYTAIQGKYMHMLSVFVSPLEYSSTRLEYYKNFLGMNFYTASSAVPKVSATPLADGKMLFFDLLGRPAKPTKQVKALPLPMVGR
jgi:hypothetical protein